MNDKAEIRCNLEKNMEVRVKNYIHMKLKGGHLYVMGRKKEGCFYYHTMEAAGREIYILMNFFSGEVWYTGDIGKKESVT